MSTKKGIYNNCQKIKCLKLSIREAFLLVNLIKKIKLLVFWFWKTVINLYSKIKESIPVSKCHNFLVSNFFG